MWIPSLLKSAKVTLTSHVLQLLIISDLVYHLLLTMNMFQLQLSHIY